MIDQNNRAAKKFRSVAKEQTDQFFLSGGEAVPLLSMCNHQVLGTGCQFVLNNWETSKAACPLPEEVPYPLLIEAIDCACKRYIFSQSGEDGNPHNYDHSTLWLLHIYHGWCRQVWSEMFLEEYLSLRIVLWSSCSGKKVAVRCFVEMFL